MDSATALPSGSTRATTNWQEAVGLQKELIRAALQGSLPTHSHSIKLFAAVDDYLKAKKATANTQRAIDFDRERLEVVKRVLGDVRFRRSPRARSRASRPSGALRARATAQSTWTSVPSARC